MTTATLTIIRTRNVPKFYDAAGIAETEAEDIDIEVTLSGSYQPAEPDVGIMTPFFGDIYAEDEYGNEIELTEDEDIRAQEALLDALANEADDDRQRAADKREDIRWSWRE